jgi:hypothetical protein
VSSFVHTFLSDTASYPFSDFHRYLGDTDVTVTPWSKSVINLPPSNTVSSSVLNGSRRELKFTHPLSGPIGPSSTRITKTQTLTTFGTTGAVLTTSSEVHDVPGGGSFRVEDCLIVSPQQEGVVEVTVMVGVVFKKFTPLKGVITKNTERDSGEWFLNWSEKAKEWLGRAD